MARIVLSAYFRKLRKKGPGVHSKCKSSKMKHSKNYVKSYRGQGR